MEASLYTFHPHRKQKFQIGDRVRIKFVGNCYRDYAYASSLVGKEGVIESCDKHYRPYFLRDFNWWFNEEELELVPKNLKHLLEKCPLKIGDRVKVVANKLEHFSIRIGDVGIIKSAHSHYSDGEDFYFNLHRIVSNGQPFTRELTFFPYELEPFPMKITKKDVAKSIEKLMTELRDAEAKYAFLTEIDAEEADSNEYRAFAALTLIESEGMSNAAKAKAIAALISEK